MEVEMVLRKGQLFVVGGFTRGRDADQLSLPSERCPIGNAVLP
jgi:hypothetical protein